jgi:hypothetical protein
MIPAEGSCLFCRRFPASPTGSTGAEQMSLLRGSHTSSPRSLDMAVKIGARFHGTNDGQSLECLHVTDDICQVRCVVYDRDPKNSGFGVQGWTMARVHVPIPEENVSDTEDQKPDFGKKCPVFHGHPALCERLRRRRQMRRSRPLRTHRLLRGPCNNRFHGNRFHRLNDPYPRKPGRYCTMLVIFLNKVGTSRFAALFCFACLWP